MPGVVGAQPCPFDGTKVSMDEANWRRYSDPLGREAGQELVCPSCHRVLGRSPYPEPFYPRGHPLAEDDRGW